jgi:hypothetical protein
MGFLFPARAPARARKGKALSPSHEVEASFQDKRFLLRSQPSSEASAALRAVGIAAPPMSRELP